MGGNGDSPPSQKRKLASRIMSRESDATESLCCTVPYSIVTSLHFGTSRIFALPTARHLHFGQLRPPECLVIMNADRMSPRKPRILPRRCTPPSLPFSGVKYGVHTRYCLCMALPPFPEADEKLPVHMPRARTASSNKCLIVPTWALPRPRP